MALFDQRYDVPPPAVIVTLSPAQNEVAPEALIVAVNEVLPDPGIGFGMYP